MRVVDAVIALTLLLFIALATACQKPLFPEYSARSPYDRYQHLHGEARPLTKENVWGAEEPAVRERLMPLDRAQQDSGAISGDQSRY